MNWKIGDKARGKHSGYIYEVIEINGDFGAGKILKGDRDTERGMILPLALDNLMPLEPRQGKPHPLTNIFK